MTLSWMYGYVKDLCSVSSDICLQVVWLNIYEHLLFWWGPEVHVRNHHNFSLRQLVYVSIIIQQDSIDKEKSLALVVALNFKL